jgi:hypothetical protein
MKKKEHLFAVESFDCASFLEHVFGVQSLARTYDHVYLVDELFGEIDVID